MTGGGDVSGNGNVWKWIAGILLSMLLTGIGGLVTGSHFSRVSDDALRREVRIERTEYVNDYVSKQITPRLDKLERGQSVILQELRTSK